jgi:hypothetical protein
MASLRRVAFFLITAAVLACALHLALDAGMHRIRYGMFGAFNRAADGQVNAEIVITGSSRASWHYDPDIIQAATGMTTFNLGRDGSSTPIHDAVLRQYLSHNRKPRLIIENLDPFSLGYDYGQLFDPAQYMPYIHDPAFYSAAKRIPELRKAYYLPLYGYVVDDLEFMHYQGLKALFGIQPPEDKQNGYRPGDYSYSNRLMQTILGKRKSVTLGILPYCSEDLGAMLDDARRRGIPAIIVLSPVYHELLVAIENRSSLDAHFAEVAQQHGAVFWDLSDVSPVSTTKANFADVFHMNRQGATLFSKIVGQRLAAWLGRRELN